MRKLLMLLAFSVMASCQPAPAMAQEVAACQFGTVAIAGLEEQVTQRGGQVVTIKETLNYLVFMDALNTVGFEVDARLYDYVALAIWPDQHINVGFVKGGCLAAVITLSSEQVHAIGLYINGKQSKS